MRGYLVKRLFAGILTVFIILTVNFIIIKIAPGDPIKTLMGKEHDNPDLRSALEEKYGLDKPLSAQYLIYLKLIFSGDLGVSIIYNRPVTQMIYEGLKPTLLLTLISTTFALLIGTSFGIIAARKEGSLFDVVFSGLAYLFNATPSFWLGLMLIILFASKLKWFPAYGMSDVRTSVTGLRYLIEVLRHMILPVSTLILIQIPSYFRVAKSSILQVKDEDYIMTLRAVGMSEKMIFNKYIFKNAILPIITLVGISMAYMITGVALTEIVFSWPGTGKMIVSAISQRDYPVLMGVYLVASVLVAIVMLAIDLVYVAFDPRIRY
ncbi:MAG: ABC transporter permease [Dethiosulfatibacter sp.]|nr:ABC transporter permease [Dethiosulfatibacter sp.]